LRYFGLRSSDPLIKGKWLTGIIADNHNNLIFRGELNFKYLMEKNLNQNFVTLQLQVIIFLFFFFNCNTLFAQINSSKGLPSITTYLPRDYKGHNQIWNIIQDERGFMYFGTSAGIIEYDGVNWTKLKFPKTSSTISNRAFHKDAEGRIFYGALGDLGYFDLDKFGNTKMVSLIDFIPEEYKVFNDVWTIHQAGKILYFQTRDMIFVFDISNGLDAPKVDVWTPDTGFMYAFYENGEYIVHQQELGLFKLIGNKLELIPGSEFLGMERVQVLLPYPIENSDSKGLLIGMFEGGMYLYDGKDFKLFPTEGYNTEGATRLYKGLIHPDGRYILGFAGAGVKIIEKNGEVQYSFNNTTGITDESVYAVFLDNAGMLWIGTENGIAKIEISSPLTRFSISKSSNTNIISLNSLGNDLYLGTPIEVLKLDHKDGLIKSVPGVPFSQIFRMARDGKDLLIATEGLVAIRDEKVITIKESIGGNFQLLDILVSKYYPDLMFCSGAFGISILKRVIVSGEEEGWEYLGDIAGISKDIYNLVEDEDGVIWGGTQAEVVYKIKLGITASKEYNLNSTKVELIGPEQGLKNAPGSVSKIRDKVYFPTTEGFFTINKTTNQFERDSVFSFSDEKVELSVENSLLIEDNLGRVLVMFGNEKKLAIPQSDGSYILEDYPINLFTGEIITAFFSESDSTIWLGSDEGLIRIDGEKKSQEDKNFSIYITEVLAGKDTLSRTPQLNKNSIPERDFKNNSIRFGFASPFFEQEQRTVYQTFLEGFEEDWSLWGENTFKEYTNLSPGNYTFHVRAKNIYNNVSEEETFKFIILSPWYATWWAYLLYVLLVILIITAIVKWRSRKLKAENRILEERVEERTAQLEKSITDLKSTQAQLIQSEKMASLGELTAGIAHEIQNPLNFVNNFSEVNKELVEEAIEELEKGDLEETKSILRDLGGNSDKINHHGKRADAIVKGMLAHSRSSSGERTPTDLNALADEYLRLSYHGLRAKDKSFNADFKTDFDPTLPKVNVVPQDMGRVLLNLINNAFQACALEGHTERSRSAIVTLTTKNLGDKIQITVSDNGPGIPDSIKDKIFQPFFTTKPTGQGTGLGLSLSYDIIKAHGGELKVESLPAGEAGKEGSGSKFIIILPHNI